jgi:hypothetical protein
MAGASRRILPALVLVALAVLPAAAAAAPPIPAPIPPQNPFMATDPNNNIHDDTWMTDAYRRGGPTGSTPVTAMGSLPPSVCGTITFDSEGRLVAACPSPTAPPELRLIDPKTLQVLASYTLPSRPSPAGAPVFQDYTGGGYFFLDHRNRVWIPTKTNHLFVLTEPAATDPNFRLVADYDLSRVVTGDERITSALPDFQGRIWFVTKKDGKVGVFDPKTLTIHVHRTNEEIENSFAVGRAGVFIVSDKRMYRFRADSRGRPHVVWQARYPNSGIHKPSQVDAGSGTTPTLMANGLVAITDNADPMDVVVYRRAAQLRGRRRTVCETPVFEKGASATENSLIGSGRSMIVENNYGYQDPLGPANGTITAPGVARVDVKPDLSGCRLVWTNSVVRAPSVVPKLSTKTGLIYTYAQDPNAVGGQTWSWVGIDARSGRTAFRVPAGDGLLANNNYAGIALGPGGTAYLGTIGGIRALRDGG